MATDQFSLPESVYQRLRSLSTQIRALAGLRGIGIGLAICVAVIACCVVLDWLVELPRVVRFGLLGTFALAAVYSLWRFVIRPLSRRFEPTELAALLESADPELNETISSAIELNDESVPEEYRGSRWMRKQLTQRTAAAADKVRPAQAVSPASAVRGLALGILALALMAMPFAMWPSSTRLMATRFFQPWKNLDRPTNLFFEIPNGNRVIALGSDARIVAIPGWRETQQELPESVLLHWTFRDGDTGSKRMIWDAGEKGFVAEIRHVVSDFDYTIAAGSVRTRNYHIQAVPAPTVETLLLDVDPPAYTGLPAEHHDGVIGEVRAFERSRLRFSISFSKPVHEASLQWQADSLPDDAPPQSLELALAPDRRSGTLRLDAAESGNFLVRLRDAVGLINDREEPRRLLIITDEPPVVQFTDGISTQQARPTDRVDVGVTASDDVGLGELSLHYSIDEEEAGTIPFAELTRSARRADHVFQLDLPTLDLPEGTSFSYRVRASDERPVPGPNVTWTQDRRIIITADADPLGAEQLSAAHEALRQKIRQIREEVADDRSETRELREQAGKTPADEASDAQQLEKLANHDAALAERLKAIARELEQHPLFTELTSRADDVANKDLPRASDGFRAAAARPAPADRKKTINEADKALATAEWKLRNLEERFTDLAALEKDLLELDRLARDTESLADHVEQFQQDQQQAEAEQDEAVRQKQQQELVDQQNELLAEQQQLEQGLDELTQRRPELIDAARQAQMDKLKALAEQARKLVPPENHLANSFQNEANRNKNPSRSTLQKARAAQQQTEQLAKAMREKNVADPVDPQPLREAVDELQRGNLEQPEAAMRKAAEELARKAESLNEAAERAEDQPAQANGDSDQAAPPKEADSTEKGAENKTPPTPKTAGAQDRKQLAEAARQASETAREVADELNKMRRDRNQNTQDTKPAADRPADADPAASDPATPPASQQPQDTRPTDDTAQPAAGDMARQQQQLAQQAQQLADLATAERGEKHPAARAAQEAAKQAENAARDAAMGELKQAAEQGQRASEREQQSSQELGKQADDRAQALSDAASELARAQQALAKQMQQAASDPNAGRQERQAAQRDMSKKISNLANELAEASRDLNSNPIDMPAQGEKAQAAEQAASQAASEAQQSANQAAQGNPEKASQAARQAAQKLQQAANQTQQASNGKVQDTPVPEDVGEQFAKAIKSVKEAGEQLGQQPGTQDTGDQQGQEPGDQQPSDQQGQQPGQQGQQPGNQPGQQGQKSQPGQQGQPGQQPGDQSKQPGQSAEQLRDAARRLAKAAQGALPQKGQQQPGKADGQGRTGENEMTGNFDGSQNGKLAELLGNRREGRDWGKLPGNLQTEILQGAKRSPNGDYSRLIRLYFREIARATDQPQDQKK